MREGNRAVDVENGLETSFGIVQIEVLDASGRAVGGIAALVEKVVELLGGIID